MAGPARGSTHPEVVDACKDGFTAKAANGDESSYDPVAPEEVTPAGDDAGRWRGRFALAKPCPLYYRQLP
ncbi:hypothetical protein TPA0906_31310 [Streptomyces olivaceus]|nr:hypothetical protein EZV63_20890 [Streptomyces sp. VN1]GHJ01266.1 hypothetical protein TPA0906_31310 [Streptomyces olivaceus]